MGKRVPSEIKTLLRENFDLSRYEACSKLDAFGWYKNLYSRGMVKFRLHEPMPEGSDQTYGKETMPHILRNPILESEFVKPLFVRPRSSSIEDISLDVLHRFQQSLAKMNELVEATEKECADEGGRALMTSVLRHDLTSPLVVIDLYATDGQLMIEFESWLKNKRSEMRTLGLAPPREKQITNKDFANWSSKKILAYIDLILLGETLNTTFPNHLIGEILFPNELDVDVSEKVRKTVKPLADDLMHRETLDTLYAAALAERSKKSE